MMRIELLVFMLLLGILSRDITHGETKLYDQHWNLRYRIEDDGRIYDRNWNLKGRIEGDRVYDKNWNLKLREDNGRLYDRNWKPKGHIERR